MLKPQTLISRKIESCHVKYIAGSNKTGGPVGSGDTSLISTSAWLPQCIGVLIYGLARPMG